MRLIACLALSAAAVVAALPVHADEEVVVYSARREPLIAPLFEAYTEATGVPVRYLTDAAPVLIERLAAEGESTPADLLMVVDAGNLWQAAERGVLQSIDSASLEENVPENLRDPEGQWFGLSQRARTIVHSTERVDAAELDGYAGLADPKWKGRLCLRSSGSVYNQSLTAMLIAREGEARTEEILGGWVANLATSPFPDDTRLIEAIAAGQCDVGVVNTYYLGRALKSRPELPVTVFWPDQDGAGVHVNVSGAGVVRHAENAAGAQKLLEWLASDAAQQEFAAVNMEFPVKQGIERDAVVAAWGDFKPDPINVVEAGRRQSDAVRLMDRIGWR